MHRSSSCSDRSAHSLQSSGSEAVFCENITFQLEGLLNQASSVAARKRCVMKILIDACGCHGGALTVGVEAERSSSSSVASYRGDRSGANSDTRNAPAEETMWVNVVAAGRLRFTVERLLVLVGDLLTAPATAEAPSRCGRCAGPSTEEDLAVLVLILIAACYLDPNGYLLLTPSDAVLQALMMIAYPPHTRVLQSAPGGGLSSEDTSRDSTSISPGSAGQGGLLKSKRKFASLTSATSSSTTTTTTTTATTAAATAAATANAKVALSPPDNVSSPGKFARSERGGLPPSPTRPASLTADLSPSPSASSLGDDASPTRLVRRYAAHRDASSVRRDVSAMAVLEANCPFMHRLAVGCCRDDHPTGQAGVATSSPARMLALQVVGRLLSGLAHGLCTRRSSVATVGASDSGITGNLKRFGSQRSPERAAPRASTSVSSPPSAAPESRSPVGISISTSLCSEWVRDGTIAWLVHKAADLMPTASAASRPASAELWTLCGVLESCAHASVSVRHFIATSKVHFTGLKAARQDEYFIHALVGAVRASADGALEELNTALRWDSVPPLVSASAMSASTDSYPGRSQSRGQSHLAEQKDVTDSPPRLSTTSPALGSYMKRCDANLYPELTTSDFSHLVTSGSDAGTIHSPAVTRVDVCNAMMRLLLNLSHHCDDAFAIAMSHADFFLQSMETMLWKITALRAEFLGLGSGPVASILHEAQRLCFDMLLLVVNILTNIVELQVMALEKAVGEGKDGPSALLASAYQHRLLSMDILMHGGSISADLGKELIGSRVCADMQGILLSELRINAADFIEVIGETKRLMPEAGSTLSGAGDSDTPPPSSSSSAEGEPGSSSGLSVESLVLCGHIVLLLFLQQSARRLQRSVRLSIPRSPPPPGESSFSWGGGFEIAPLLPGGSWYVPMRLLTAFLALHGKTGVGRIESVQPVIDAIEALRTEIGSGGSSSNSNS